MGNGFSHPEKSNHTTEISFPPEDLRNPLQEIPFPAVDLRNPLQSLGATWYQNLSWCARRIVLSSNLSWITCSRWNLSTRTERLQW